MGANATHEFQMTRGISRALSRMRIIPVGYCSAGLRKGDVQVMYNQTQHELGEFVRWGRNRIGLTQHEVATRARISVGGLRDIEQNRVARPRTSTLRRLAAALELSPVETEEFVQRGQQGSVLANDLRMLVLGPLGIRVEGSRVELNSVRQRVILSLLALSPNTTVSVDALADGMSDGQVLPSAVDVVRAQVSRLRRRLQPNGSGPVVLVANVGGYMLQVESNQLDLLAFRKLAGSARRDAKAGRLELAARQYRTAIELRRGSPLADLPELHTHPAVVELNRELESVLLDYADVALRVGRHAELLGPLRGFIDANPLHERAHASLMIALARSGQRAAALELFENLRRNLAHELGVDPVREVTEAYLAVLSESDDTLDAGQANVRPRLPPAQLPADLPGFVGREHHLAHLDAVLAHKHDSTPIVAIHGLGGVGKSALAVHWAHRMADRFPDGHLYADIAGNDPADVLHAFLIALGISPLMMPTELSERAGLYRSIVCDKRLLIVLDNVAHPYQVRSLLPGSAGCFVVVTSRYQMRGLVAAEGATPLPLDVLSMDEARTLLHRRIGSGRLLGELEIVDEIIARSGRLPLALALAAARAITNPQLPLAGIVAELRDDAAVLDAFSTGEDATDPRMIFAAVHRTLSSEAAKLFATFGELTEPSFRALTIHESRGAPGDRIGRLLNELVKVHFINEVQHGYYTIHPLVHAYARELASQRSATTGIWCGPVSEVGAED
ncbi:BTAD domain-containing putative transcriptional regulator [Nocardia sp. NPDC050793]|uniref:BTAD domain-containing putative transcriptional regulator n=1 Tax=Nocardia sp. NPDC050793 TaxID=3155159 RepID=UPI0033CA25D3